MIEETKQTAEWDDSIPFTNETHETEEHFIDIGFTEEELQKINKDATAFEMPVNEYVIQCAMAQKPFLILKRFITLKRLLQNLYASVQAEDIPENYRSKILSKAIDMSDTLEEMKTYLDNTIEEETSNG